MMMTHRVVTAFLLFGLGLASHAQLPPKDPRTAIVSQVLAAISKDDGPLIERLIAGDSSDYLKINEDISRGRTILDAAAEKCAPKSVAALLKNRADPNGSKTDRTALSPLTRAALACARDIPAQATAVVQALLTAGAEPNANYFTSGITPTEVDPQSFVFLRSCNTATALQPSYLTILGIWLKGGLKATSTSSADRGQVSLLHYIAAVAASPLCVEAARLLAAASVDADFRALDNRGRPPIDFTLGPSAFFHNSKSYGITCMTGGPEEGANAPLRVVRSLFSSPARPTPDLARACTDLGESKKSTFTTGTDPQGRPFMIREYKLDRVTDKVTTHSPDCSDPPGGWSRCAVVRFEPLPPNLNLLASPAPSYWRKDSDGVCPGSFDPAKHHNPREAGYVRCNGDCGNPSAIHPTTPLTSSGTHYLYVQALLKNWSQHQDYCYAIVVYPGP